MFADLWLLIVILLLIKICKLDILTLSPTFYDLSVSRDFFSKAEVRKLSAPGTEGLKVEMMTIF